MKYTGPFQFAIRLCLLGSCLLTASAAAQAPVRLIDSGPFEVDLLTGGPRLLATPDLDGDGTGDLLTGFPDDDLANPDAGRVVARSGADDCVIWEITGASGARLGASLDVIEDLDGDGVVDILVGADGNNRVRLVSGDDGSTIDRIVGTPGELFAAAVATTDDYDGDGTDDIAVGAPDALGGAGSVFIHSGIGGALITTLTSQSGGRQFGRALSGQGDYDGDGLRDLLVGAPAQSQTSEFAVFSGSFLASGTGSLVLIRKSLGPNHALGASTAFLGDLDGVLGDEVGVSAIQARRLYVYGAASGDPLYELTPAHPTFALRFASHIGSMGDLNGDTVPDFLVGSAKFPEFVPEQDFRFGDVRIFSGLDASVLIALDGGAFSFGDGSHVPHSGGVASVAPGGDTDGDGIAEFLVAFTNEQGDMVRFETEGPMAWAGENTLSDMGAPLLLMLGDLTGGSTTTLQMAATRPSSGVVVFIGFSELNAPLYDGTLVPATDVILVLGTDAQGEVSVSGAWPAGVPSGFDLAVQGWFADPITPQGFSATNALVGQTP